MKDNNVSYGSIVGYPRSGNNWLRFIIEYLTNYQTAFPPMDTKMRNPLHLLSSSIDSVKKIKDGVIWDIHNYKDTLLNKVTENKGKLILILRNYKECIIRHYQLFKNLNKFSKINEKQFKIIDREYLEYLKLVDYFDKYDGEKEIIYYEDIINKNNIKESLVKIVSFLNGDFSKIKNFIDSYDSLSSESKFFYQKHLSGSQSPPGTKIYYSKYLTSEKKEIMDNIIKNSYPNLEKYLKVYYE